MELWKCGIALKGGSFPPPFIMGPILVIYLPDYLASPTRYHSVFTVAKVSISFSNCKSAWEWLGKSWPYECIDRDRGARLDFVALLVFVVFFGFFLVCLLRFPMRL